MEKTLTVQVRELEEMTAGELAEKYEEIFGEEPRSRNRLYLFKRVAYGLQEKAEGGLSERAHRRRKQITDEAHLRVRQPKAAEEAEQPQAPAPAKRDARLPKSGTVLVREHGGKRHEVQILDDGFLYEKKRYRSLSAVARAITGTPWNGFRFFADAIKEHQ
jgi:hypothetical protein